MSETQQKKPSELFYKYMKAKYMSQGIPESRVEDVLGRNLDDKAIFEIAEAAGVNPYLTEEELTNDMFDIIKSMAFKTHCDEDSWNSIVSELKGDKDKIILFSLGVLYKDFPDVINKATSGDREQSEFLTYKQLNTFHMYMTLHLYDKAA